MQFDKNGNATDTGLATIYGFDKSGAYIGPYTVTIFVGTGIPSGATLTPPPDYSNQQIPVYNGTQWTVEPDHRGETVYSTQNGAAITITGYGDYPSDTTIIPPKTQYDAWDGSQWITDNDAHHAGDVANAEHERAELIEQANAYINSKQWPGKAAMGRLSDAEKSLYNTWLDYLDALEAIDTSSAPDVSWPSQPDNLEQAQ